MCILAIREYGDPAYRLLPKRVTADKDISRYYDVILSDDPTEGVIRRGRGCCDGRRTRQGGWQTENARVVQ